MTLNLITKGGIALLGGTGVATGGYLLYSNIAHKPKSKDSFKSKIESSGKSLINGNNSQWSVKIAVYNKGGNTNKIRIDGQEKNSITQIELEGWCSRGLELEYSEKNNFLFSLVERWCLTPTIKEALSREQKGIIPTEGELNAGWQAKISARSSNVQSVLITNLKLTATTGNTVAPETLRDWCKSQLKKEYTGDDRNHYSQSKDWCLLE